VVGRRARLGGGVGWRRRAEQLRAQQWRFRAAAFAGGRRGRRECPAPATAAEETSPTTKRHASSSSFVFISFEIGSARPSARPRPRDERARRAG
jgi:hypothetical protein